MLHDQPGLGRGGGQEIMVVGQPRRRAVVIDQSVLAQHQPVACLADREVREGVDVDAIEEDAGIGAVHVDLAERRDVAEADAAAHRPDLARHRFQPVFFARLRIPLRALPQAGVDEHRALLGGPMMRRGQPHAVEILVAVMAGKRADGDRHIGRAVDRGAGLGNGFACHRRHDGKAGTFEVLPWSVAMPSVV